MSENKEMRAHLAIFIRSKYLVCGVTSTWQLSKCCLSKVLQFRAEPTPLLVASPLPSEHSHQHDHSPCPLLA
jgi:hypothetical protein